MTNHEFLQHHGGSKVSHWRISMDQYRELGSFMRAGTIYLTWQRQDLTSDMLMKYSKFCLLGIFNSSSSGGHKQNQNGRAGLFILAELADCDSDNHGCDGMEDAFKFMWISIREHGVFTGDCSRAERWSFSWRPPTQ
uniref:Uncharacterized protein n=1 Tax=Salix viminalis TaxID=40686 RepID=A0A6N2N2R1_SALVM